MRNKKMPSGSPAVVKHAGAGLQLQPISLRRCKRYLWFSAEQCSGYALDVSAIRRQTSHEPGNVLRMLAAKEWLTRLPKHHSRSRLYHVLGEGRLPLDERLRGKLPGARFQKSLASCMRAKVASFLRSAEVLLGIA
jgi:hypothetical protein